MAPELVYRMPVRRNVRRDRGSGFDPRMMHFDDNHATTQLRIRRLLESDGAYAEDPPSRRRRVVADITVFDTDVVSALRRVSDGFLLAKRTVLVD